MNKSRRQWCKANPEKARAMAKRKAAKIRATPRGILNNRISIAIRVSLRGNKRGRSWESLVGYTLDQLKCHIEKQFTIGMSWENHGQWHIDHKIPIAAFNYQSPEDTDFKKCWALKNLRPMWAVENIKKKDRIETPFQPSLLI
jgi:hypothetical protein